MQYLLFDAARECSPCRSAPPLACDRVPPAERRQMAARRRAISAPPRRYARIRSMSLSRAARMNATRSCAAGTGLADHGTSTPSITALTGGRASCHIGIPGPNPRRRSDPPSWEIHAQPTGVTLVEIEEDAAFNEIQLGIPGPSTESCSLRATSRAPAPGASTVRSSARPTSVSTGTSPDSPMKEDRDDREPRRHDGWP